MAIEVKLRYNVPVSGIYRWLNTVNGRSYVGSSRHLYRRKTEHIWDLANKVSHNKRLQRAYYKYGVDSFQFEILELCSDVELAEKELYWIKKHNSVKFGYNFSEETDCPSRGKELTKSWKKNIGKAHKGRKMPNQVAQALKRAREENPVHRYCRLGMKASEETREKLRLSHLGKSGALNGSSVPVVQLDLNYNLIAQYAGVSEAEGITGIKRKCICNCLHNRSKSAGGFLWKKLKDYSQLKSA